MRYGYWLPIFGGWLRNVPDEGMAATWDYVKRLACRSEQIGYDLTLVAELNLNDIKGTGAPALDAWSTAAALAAVTERLELMVAVRPTFHSPALLAKQAANIDNICGTPAACRSTSSPPGGPTRPSSTASISSSTRTATRARPSGWKSSTACGPTTASRTPASTTASRTRSSSPSPSPARARPSTPAVRARRRRTSSPSVATPT